MQRSRHRPLFELAALLPLVLVGYVIGLGVRTRWIDDNASRVGGLAPWAIGLAAVVLLVLGGYWIFRDFAHTSARWWRAFLPAVALPLAAGVLAAYAEASSDSTAWDLLKVALCVQAIAALGLLSWHDLPWRWFWQVSLLLVGVTGLLAGGTPWTRLGYGATIAALLLIIACNASRTSVRAMTMLTLALSACLLARIGSHLPAATGQGFLSQVNAGLGALLTDIIRPIAGADARVEMSPGGWIAVAVVIASIHRGLELRSGQREVGPVTVNTFSVATGGGEGHPDPDYLARRLRTELAAVSIAEPGTIPTAEVGREVASVLSNDVTKHGPFVAALIKLLNNLAFPATGLVVEPTYDESGGTSSGKHRVSVAVKTANRGQLVFAEELTGASLDQVMRRAAACIGDYALSHGDTVPDWSAWPDDDSVALELYLRYRHASSECEKAHLLEAIHAANPGNGVLSVELGLCREASGKPVSALLLYLSAAQTFPSFILARYRSVVVLQAVADTVATKPAHSLDERERLRHLLPDVEWDDRTNGARGLLEEARTRAKRTARSITLPATFWRAFVRPDERLADLHLVNQRNARQRLARQIRIVQQIVEIRRVGLDASDLTSADQKFVKKADKRIDRACDAVEEVLRHASQSSDLVRYNGACFFAVLARTYAQCGHRVSGAQSATEAARLARERAIQLLWDAYRSPGNDALTYTWTSRDPDLVPLEGEADFESLLIRLSEDSGTLWSNAEIPDSDDKAWTPIPVSPNGRKHDARVS
jgi:hypothetical protein